MAQIDLYFGEHSAAIDSRVDVTYHTWNQWCREYTWYGDITQEKNGTTKDAELLRSIRKTVFWHRFSCLNGSCTLFPKIFGMWFEISICQGQKTVKTINLLKLKYDTFNLVNWIHGGLILVIIALNLFVYGANRQKYKSSIFFVWVLK